ncbi:MAG: hypothetical protein J1F60_09005 [Oscillospiraceae bacterium]|nr:hypothetical protein [Oscillospiraceae bacterium]
MHKLPKLICSAFLAGALAATSAGCYFFPDEEPELEPPTLDVAEVVYSTYTASRKDIASQTYQSGYIVSAVEEECFFTQYTGRLKNIYVNPGDYVEEGDLIAEMNNGAIEYRLEIQRLRVELARLNYNTSGSAADRLQLEIEQNTLASYQAEYDGGHVYAPISGQVSYVKTLNPGDEVDPYDVIVRIVDPERLCVSFTTTSFTDYYVGDEVQVEVNDVYYDAVVVRTPREETAEGDEVTDKVFVEFVGDGPGFGYLGAIGSVVKVTASAENAIVIPKYIVKTDGDRKYVQVLRDDVKVEVDIETGIETAVEVEILSGLSEGDKVIVK